MKVQIRPSMRLVQSPSVRAVAVAVVNLKVSATAEMFVCNYLYSMNLNLR